MLQFIGATNDEGSPLFVTELMELSLRALLEQRRLTQTQISVISLDISRALNYLHHMKPSPIVHRDVSSANVMLWRRGEQWRGKVSNYGTAKFVQQTMTLAPGALIYSAPEAVSSNQTSMVSFLIDRHIFVYPSLQWAIISDFREGLLDGDFLLNFTHGNINFQDTTCNNTMQ